MKSVWSAMAEEHPLDITKLSELDKAVLDTMKQGAADVQESYRLLNKAGINIVGEIIKGQGTFYEMDHYPKDDVYDNETYCQYYYHSHRNLAEEHGHFHTFIRAKGFPFDLTPLTTYKKTEPWPENEEAICHFTGIAMDVYGFPIGLFATNRWVTAESWYKAQDVIGMLDDFEIDHAHPNLSVNRWLTGMLKLYRPYIESLLIHRDKVIASWAEKHPGSDVLEDRNLEVTGYIPVSSIDLLEELKVI